MKKLFIEVDGEMYNTNHIVSIRRFEKTERVLLDGLNNKDEIDHVFTEKVNSRIKKENSVEIAVMSYSEFVLFLVDGYRVEIEETFVIKQVFSS